MLDVLLRQIVAIIVRLVGFVMIVNMRESCSYYLRRPRLTEKKERTPTLLGLRYPKQKACEEQSRGASLARLSEQ